MTDSGTPDSAAAAVAAAAAAAAADVVAAAVAAAADRELGHQCGDDQTVIALRGLGKGIWSGWGWTDGVGFASPSQVCLAARVLYGCRPHHQSCPTDCAVSGCMVVCCAVSEMLANPAWLYDGRTKTRSFGVKS